MKTWHKILGGGVIGVALLTGGLLLAAQPAEPPTWFRTDDPDFLVIAHQGGNHLRPDNTLLAFEHARDLGVDVLEMDLNMTADGELVVIHDVTVDRTTDGSGAVSEMTLAEIKALDAAYHWTPLTPEGDPIDAGDHPYRGQGIEVPTLDEVIAEFGDMRMLIEIKQVEPPLHDPFCDLLRETDMTEQVIVASFDVGALDAFRAACPEVPTSGHLNEVLGLYLLTRVYLGPAYSPGEVVALQIPERWDGLRVISPRFVRAAHSRGLAVQAWTINTEEDMRRMIEMGVDGLITDQPGLALELRGE